MEPNTIIAITLSVLTALNEILGYTPDGMPKNISQLIGWSFKCKNINKKEETELKDVNITIR